MTVWPTTSTCLRVDLSCFHVWIGISLTGAGWGMWTHRHLLPARVYFNDKNKFLSELWPAQSTVRIAFSAGVYPCSYGEHPSPVSHCLSSQRLLQALLRSWCLEDLVQSARKKMQKLGKARILLINDPFSLQIPQRLVYLYSLSSQNDTSLGCCVSLPNALHFVNETCISAQATIPLMVFRRNKASFWKHFLALQAFLQ